jgi:hypothetical protein
VYDTSKKSHAPSAVKRFTQLLVIVCKAQYERTYAVGIQPQRSLRNHQTRRRQQKVKAHGWAHACIFV